MNKKEQLKQINIDIVFFFLFLVSASISFYIINEKKKEILDIPHFENEKLNNLFIFNRRLIVIIDVYFMLNAYNSYVEISNNPHSDKELEDIKLILGATILIFIASLLYLPITNSSFIAKR